MQDELAKLMEPICMCAKSRFGNENQVVTQLALAAVITSQAQKSVATIKVSVFKKVSEMKTFHTVE